MSVGNTEMNSVIMIEVVNTTHFSNKFSSPIFLCESGGCLPTESHRYSAFFAYNSETPCTALVSGSLFEFDHFQADRGLGERQKAATDSS